MSAAAIADFAPPYGGAKVAHEADGEAKPEPEDGLEPTTYRLQGGCSTS